MDWLRDSFLRLALLVFFFPIFEAKRSGRLLISSIPEACQTARINLDVGQMAWIVSPGHKVPGITDVRNGICKWSVKVPPGHGIRMEIVRFRLRNSRHCQRTSVQITPRLSVHHQVKRRLTRFCGRGPRSKMWTTTYSEIDLEYIRLENHNLQSRNQGDITKNPPQQKNITGVHLDDRSRPVPSRSHGRSKLSTDENLDKIKALQQYYLKKRANQERDEPYRYQQRVAQIKTKIYRFKQRYRSLDNRRFYRHSSYKGDNVHHEIDNATSITDEDNFPYGNESLNGSVSLHPQSNHIRLLAAYEPTWINDNELRSTKTKCDKYQTVFGHTSKTSEKFHKNIRKKKKIKRKIKKKIQLAIKSENSVARIVRSAGPLTTSRGEGITRSYSTRYYVTYGRPTASRKKRRFSIKKYNEAFSTKPGCMQDAQSPSETVHKEIIYEKPIKFSFLRESKETSKPNNLMSSPSILQESKDPTENILTRKEYFVIKVSTFQTLCGGYIAEKKGRFTSPEYPKKMGGKNSCYWNFQTSGESSWKLHCTNFHVRKSPRCRRDHMAIRINDAVWTRYCGRVGPNLTLTSSHSSRVEIALNTFRNSSARVICSWETVTFGHQNTNYQKYWSYELTKIPVTTPSTTTTTTTSLIISKAKARNHSRICLDYIHFSKEHTMCKPTPSTCLIYKEGVTTIDQQDILRSHNTYRAKIARGEEFRGLPGPQYSAADMQQLSWNRELAQVAQAWASACPDYHDCHECRKILSRSYHVGQNIFYEWSSSNPGPVWETAVRLWYEEVKYVPNHLVKNFRVMKHAVIGHYTQLVWADTKEIGCGAAYHDCTKIFRGHPWKLKCKIYVCNYGPTGNYLRKPVYTIGLPASACPDGSIPSLEYPGLCTSR